MGRRFGYGGCSPLSERADEPGEAPKQKFWSEDGSFRRDHGFSRGAPFPFNSLRKNNFNNGRKRMRQFQKVLILEVFLFLGFVITSAFAQAPDTELALFEEIPMVVTPGKKLQPITESPAAVYVITQEDIKQSGAINLWEVLREVPGMDVVMGTIGQADVSMRGFADMATNKTLLLIDGRTMYLPLQGLLLWEMIPVQLEEIDRIEVVKGPVASLYGANANLGLINIITKTPGQMDGGTLSTTGGTRDTKRFAVMYGKEANKNFAYKVSTGWKDMNSFNNERDRDALDGVQGNMQLDYKIDDDSKASLSAGTSQNDSYLLTSTDAIAQQFYFGPLSHTLTYIKGDYDVGNFSSRIFWNHYGSKFKTKVFDSAVEMDTFDGELRYAFEPIENHSAIIGGGGRFDNVDSTIFSDSDKHKHTQGIWDFFAEDQYKLSEKWTINGSARVDHYGNSGYNPSARIATMYYPNKVDLWRWSTGYSFRSPTLSDYYLKLPVDVTGGGVISTAHGNKNVKPERYLTYEIDYEGKRMDGRLRPFVSIYFTRISGLIEPTRNGGGLFGLDATFLNRGRADSSGGELGTEYDVNKTITLIGNYAVNHVKYNDADEIHFNPKHKANAGFKLKFLDNRLSTKFLAHYVSGAHTTSGDDGKVPAYVLSNLWIGYQVTKDLEASIAGYNIFNDKHQEFIGGDDIGSRVLGKLQLNF